MLQFCLHTRNYISNELLFHNQWVIKKCCIFLTTKYNTAVAQKIIYQYVRFLLYRYNKKTCTKRCTIKINNTRARQKKRWKRKGVKRTKNMKMNRAKSAIETHTKYIWQCHEKKTCWDSQHFRVRIKEQNILLHAKF